MSEQYIKDWVRVVLMVSPSGEYNAIGGDRVNGDPLADLPYIGKERLDFAKARLANELAAAEAENEVLREQNFAMNQQEVTDLFKKYGYESNDFEPELRLTLKGFAQAAAEIRRQTLEEVAAQIHARLYDHAQDPEIEDSITAQARFLEAEAIQEMVHEMIDEGALAQSEQEKS